MVRLKWLNLKVPSQAPLSPAVGSASPQRSAGSSCPSLAGAAPPPVTWRRTGSGGGSALVGEAAIGEGPHGRRPLAAAMGDALGGGGWRSNGEAPAAGYGAGGGESLEVGPRVCPVCVTPVFVLHTL